MELSKVSPPMKTDVGQDLRKFEKELMHVQVDEMESSPSRT